MGGVVALTVAMFALRGAANMVLFCCVAMRAGPADEAPKVEAATAGQIAALPLARISAATCAEDCPNCAICLVDFLAGEKVRRLPCGHDFHSGCVDTWLRRNKKCPLCLRAIDEQQPARRKFHAECLARGLGQRR